MYYVVALVAFLLIILPLEWVYGQIGVIVVGILNIFNSLETIEKKITVKNKKTFCLGLIIIIATICNIIFR